MVRIGIITNIPGIISILLIVASTCGWYKLFYQQAFTARRGVEFYTGTRNLWSGDFDGAVCCCVLLFAKDVYLASTFAPFKGCHGRRFSNRRGGFLL